MRLSATSRSIVPSLSDTPSLPPQTQTPLCLFPEAKPVQTEGKGSRGGVSQTREESLDGEANMGDGRDRLMKKMGGREKLFCMTECRPVWEKRKGGGSQSVRVGGV